MEKQSGFTLIELVIVIIILGILAATAVPKFIDLQDDARNSALQGLKGALEGATTLAYSRASIKGIKNGYISMGNSTVKVVNGYPEASSEGIDKAINLSTDDWVIKERKLFDTEKARQFYPKGRPPREGYCGVLYTLDPYHDRPLISVGLCQVVYVP